MISGLMNTCGRLTAAPPPPSGRVGVLKIDHQKAARDANLDCGKADARSLVHRIEHVADEPLQIAVDALDRRWRCSAAADPELR